VEHSQLPIQWVNGNPLRGIQLAWRKAEHFYPPSMLRMQKGNPVFPIYLNDVELNSTRDNSTFTFTFTFRRTTKYLGSLKKKENHQNITQYH